MLKFTIGSMIVASIFLNVCRTSPSQYDARRLETQDLKNKSGDRHAALEEYISDLEWVLDSEKMWKRSYIQSMWNTSWSDDRFVDQFSELYGSRAKKESCAIVLNSGSNLRYERGHEIDSHDIVIRFNVAPITGFERYIGTKLDFFYTETMQGS